MPRLDGVSIGCEFNKAAEFRDRYLRAADHLSLHLSRPSSRTTDCEHMPPIARLGCPPAVNNFGTIPRRCAPSALSRLPPSCLSKKISLARLPTYIYCTSRAAFTCLVHSLLRNAPGFFFISRDVYIDAAIATRSSRKLAVASAKCSVLKFRYFNGRLI